jgi:hypothetical protein
MQHSRSAVTLALAAGLVGIAASDRYAFTVTEPADEAPAPVPTETVKFRTIDPSRAHTLQAPRHLRVGTRSKKPHQIQA